jgi:hypothetical protein
MKMSENKQASKISWEDVPRESLNDFLGRRLITGEKVMLANVYLKKGCIVPPYA